MRKYLLFLALILKLSAAFAQKTAADEAYTKQDYATAATLYEKELATKVSPELYYNLANAYYRQHNLGLAMLNYERALRLAPADNAIRESRNLCATKLLDNLPEKPRNFLQRGAESLSLAFSPNTWAVFGILFLILSLSGFGIYYFHPLAKVKKWAFFLSRFTLTLCAVSNYYAWSFRRAYHSNKRVVVMQQTVLRSTPSAFGDSVRSLHEGYVAEFTDSLQGFYALRLPDNTNAWGDAKHIVKL